MKPAITDVFFDLDHTLWDFDRNSALAFDAVFERQNLRFDRELFLHYYVPINLKYWERYRCNAISQQELRHGRLKETFDLIGFDADNTLIDIISDEYIRDLPLNNHLFEGTIELLDYLSEKYRLHIITNGFAEIQQKKLVNSGILKYFATVTDSEIAGVKKPDPKIFSFALDRAGASAENSIMIGDCIDADVRGAIRCGWKAILFGRHDDPAIDQIATLPELKNHL